MRQLLLFPVVFFLGISQTLAAPAIPFTVNLSENVTVTGTPRVAVDVGGQTRYATYTSGSGTTALTFTLSPQAGDVDLDGITVSSPIDLNGGTMKDAAGNNAALTFTPPNTSGIKVNYPSLGMDFVYDADGRYTLNGTVYNDLTGFLTAAGGTFSRASIGTYYDSTGTLQTASSGAPRFDWDPVTHAAKGILIEESRTNYLKNSADFLGTGWSRTRMIATSAATTAPDGTLTGTHISDNGVAGATYTRQTSLTYTANTKYAISIYAKKAELDILRIDWYASTGWAANGYVNFNLTTGTATPSGAVDSYTITPVGNGWFRCVAVALFGAATQISTYPSYAIPSPPLDSTSGFYVWGAQIEQGSFATSYIPTTSATVTRAADALSMSTSAWYSPSSGSIFAYYSYLPAGSGYGMTYARNNSAIFRFSRNAQSSFINQFSMGRYLANGPSNPYRLTVSFRDQSGTGADISNLINLSTNMDGEGPFKSVAAYGVSGAVATSQGQPLASNSTGFSSFQFDNLALDSSYDGSVGVKHLRQLKYYPARLSDSFLQQMTQ